VNETWRAVPGWESTHIVSDLGRVATLDRVDAAGRRRRGRILKPIVQNKTGHLKVSLQHLFRREPISVHRLVLFAFVGPCPPGMQACHENDVAGDNRLVNLRWDTPAANVADAYRNGRRAEATQCQHGHPLSGSNLYVYSNGRRECRTRRLETNRRNRPEKTPERRARHNELQRIRRARRAA
jgi:hypothetical protein